MTYRTAPFSLTLNDPYPRFQGHAIFDAEYLRNDTKNCYGNSLQLVLCYKHDCFLTLWFIEHVISEILFKLKNF